MWGSHESPELRSNRTQRPSQSWTNRSSWMIILVNIVPPRHKWGVRLLRSSMFTNYHNNPRPPHQLHTGGRGDTFYIPKLMNHGDSVKSRLYFVSFAFIEIQRISFQILLLNSILFVWTITVRLNTEIYIVWNMESRRWGQRDQQHSCP